MKAALNLPKTLKQAADFIYSTISDGTMGRRESVSVEGTYLVAILEELVAIAAAPKATPIPKVRLSRADGQTRLAIESLPRCLQDDARWQKALRSPIAKYSFVEWPKAYRTFVHSLARSGFIRRVHDRHPDLFFDLAFIGTPKEKTEARVRLAQHFAELLTLLKKISTQKARVVFRPYLTVGAGEIVLAPRAPH